MFSLPGRRRPTPNDDPTIVPGFTPTPTPRDLVERSVKALDAVLDASAGQPEKNWELLDRVLDERLALRPARLSLRPSVPVNPGRAS